MKTVIDLQNKFSKRLYGMTKTEANEKGICVQCKQPALDNCYSEVGRKEYYISGLCEKCFDKITKEQ